MDKHLQAEKQKMDLYRTICQIQDTYESILLTDLGNMLEDAKDAAGNRNKLIRMDDKKYLFPCPYWFVKQYMHIQENAGNIRCIDMEKDIYSMNDINRILTFTIAHEKSEEMTPALSCESWNTEITFHVDKKYIPDNDTLEQQLYSRFIGKNESELIKRNMNYDRNTKILTYFDHRFRCAISPFTKRIMGFSIIKSSR